MIVGRVEKFMFMSRIVNHLLRCPFLLLAICFLSLTLQAQDRFSDNLSLSFNYHYGFMLPEYSNIVYLAKAPVQSASVNLSKRTNGKNDWEHLYHFPEYGLSLFYSTLGNDRVNGREIALFPFFRLNIISGRKLRLYNETGIGLAYATKRFDLNDNYLNVAIGSHLNIHFDFKLGLDYKVAPRIQWNAGVSFDHFSNSNTKEPNLGLNYATVFTGLQYRVGDELPQQERTLSPHEKRFYYEFIYSAGGKYPRAVGSKMYFTSSATFEIKWAPFRALHFGIGPDLFYDTSTEAEMLTVELKNFRKAYQFRSGIHVSQELVYNKFSLILQEGFYLLLTDHVEKNVMYNRGIIRFRVSENFFVQLAMKSHLQILDYPEIGLGVRW
jgi:hypothetical protein